MHVSRRSFLTVASAALAMPRLRAETGSEPLHWRAGLGLNGFMSSASTYGKEYPIWEVLDFAARAGFDGIELVEGWPMGSYPESNDEKRVSALKGLYDRYGLRVYTIQTGGSDAYAADPERRKAWIAAFAERVHLCQALGCNLIGHWPGGGLEGNRDVDQAIQHLAASYVEAATLCADAGMHLSFEIEPPFIFNTEEHLARILSETDHPACKTNYDPSHFDLMSGSQGKPEQMLGRIGVDHIGHVHLTDTDGTLYQGTSRHVACGEGHCGIGESLEVLRAGGYKGWIMIDAWMIEDVYHAAQKGIGAIDRVRKAG
ncbi:MAG: sugar phosphate isomerase/epimerase [Candidatus Hydrogenedentes bacterium]|nr:sugar phosphate isomerase/epimerase [Candidatus Hydrogenedentota bacterium]